MLTRPLRDEHAEVKLHFHKEEPMETAAAKGKGV